MSEFIRLAGPLLGRALLSAIFIIAGITKITGFEQTAAYMDSKGLPMTGLLLNLTILIELGGGLMILIGWQARWAALALIVFMVVATFYFHDFWNVPKEQYINQFHHFFKNLGLIGALFMVMGMGSGAMSVEKSGT